MFEEREREGEGREREISLVQFEIAQISVTGIGTLHKSAQK